MPLKSLYILLQLHRQQLRDYCFACGVKALLLALVTQHAASHSHRWSARVLGAQNSRLRLTKGLQGQNRWLTVCAWCLWPPAAAGAGAYGRLQLLQKDDSLSLEDDQHHHLGHGDRWQLAPIPMRASLLQGTASCMLTRQDHWKPSHQCALHTSAGCASTSRKKSRKKSYTVDHTPNSSLHA